MINFAIGTTMFMNHSPSLARGLFALACGLVVAVIVFALAAKK